MLLLNRVLTVAPGAPGSHRGKGWEAVTEQAIRALALRDKPLVSILWGRDARTLKPLLHAAPEHRERAPEPALGAQRVLRLAAVLARQRAARRAGRGADRLAPALSVAAALDEEEGYGKTRSRLTVLVGLLVFFDLVLWFAVAPLLPGWEHSLHLSKAQSGIVVGAYSAAVLLASVPAGSLADRFGPRRVTIAATILFAIAAPLHAFVGSFAELVSLRFAAGVFSAVSWSAALAWAIGSVPPARRGRTAALINAGLPVGAIAGPLFGGPLVHLVGQKAAMGGLGVLVLMLGAVASREPEVTAAREHEHVPLRDSIRTVARDSWLLSANVALIVLAITGTTMQTLGSLHLEPPRRVAERRRRGLHGRGDCRRDHDAHDRAHLRPRRPPQARGPRHAPARADGRGDGAAARHCARSSPRWSRSASPSRSASRPPTRWPRTAPSGRGWGRASRWACSR